MSSTPAVECMELGPQASVLEESTGTQISAHSDWSEALEVYDPTATGMAFPPPLSASARIRCASEYGIGEDNPSDPHELNDLQAARSLVAMFESTSCFQIRYGSRRYAIEPCSLDQR